MKKLRYKEWTRIQWDGNPALNLECWRKSFRRGHVSVGIGKLKTIVFSYGPDSDDSYSSTRTRIGSPDMTESEAMALVDESNGRTA